MKLFISWSKETSHAVALALREWLPLIVPSVEPWVSSEDIAKGTRGRDAIVRELAGTGQGVICLTKENVREPWLNFEAGALSNHPDKPRVRTVLFDLKVSDVVGPLSDFQHTDLNDREDVWKFVQSINDESEPKLSETQLRTYFDSFWDRLSGKLEQIRKRQAKLPSQDDSDSAVSRTPEQVIEEVLERIRTVERRQRMMSSEFRALYRLSRDIAESVGVTRTSDSDVEVPTGARPVRYVIDPKLGVGEIEKIEGEHVYVDFGDGARYRMSTKVLQSGRVADTRARAELAYRNMKSAESAADGGSDGAADADDEPPF